MRELSALGNKVLGTMVDGFDLKTTKGGVIIKETDATAEAIRPRWFEVTHIGPDSTDVAVGNFVLVAHGRWTRGIDFAGVEGLLYRIDEEEILGVSETLPEAVV